MHAGYVETGVYCLPGASIQAAIWPQWPTILSLLGHAL